MHRNNKNARNRKTKNTHIKRHNHRKYCQKIKTNILKIKNYTHEIFVGVIIGIIVIVLTPIINDKITNNKIEKEIKHNLNNLNLGMSDDYINGIFGNPIIKGELEKSYYGIDEEGQITFTTAGYKLNNCVLLCLYRNNSLLAFVVVVNEKNIYKVPETIYLHDNYLLDFTYADFCAEVPSLFWGNVPGNNDDYAYYYEIQYGGGPANYNYFILGNYKDYIVRDEGSNRLMWAGQDYAIKDWEWIEDKYNQEEHCKIREEVHPNVFGVVHGDYAEDFDFVSDIVRSRMNASLLFDDWE